jgi:hypothetical protein
MYNTLSIKIKDLERTYNIKRKRLIVVAKANFIKRRDNYYFYYKLREDKVSLSRLRDSLTN